MPKVLKRISKDILETIQEQIQGGTNKVIPKGITLGEIPEEISGEIPKKKRGKKQ